MKIVKLSEEAYNKLKECIVNEISFRSVDNASYKSENAFYEMRVAFDDFYETVRYNSDPNNPYVKKIKAYADAIDVILSQKDEQRKNFDKELGKVDHKKFYDDETRPEEMDDLDDVDLRYLQNKYPKDISNLRFNGRHMEER